MNSSFHPLYSSLSVLRTKRSVTAYSAYSILHFTISFHFIVICSLAEASRSVLRLLFVAFFRILFAKKIAFYLVNKCAFFHRLKINSFFNLIKLYFYHFIGSFNCFPFVLNMLISAFLIA